MNRDVTREIPANFFAHFQRPFMELTELQMRTLKDFSYLKPEEISRIKRPQELFEKNMMSLSSNVRESSERVMSQVEKMSQSGQDGRNQSEGSERGDKQQQDEKQGGGRGTGAKGHK